jgi:hypothetical protein
MRKITEIYSEYKIPPNLQRHMLWVAAVASMICDNFNEPLPKEDIITACLLHDMGNIIKYDMKYFPQYYQPEGEEYWQKVKDDYIKKYGKNEHEATIKIIKELGLSDTIIDVVDKVKFSLSCENSNGNNMAYKIVNYSDWRVSPHGIVSYKERMDEAGVRYQNRKDSKDIFPEEGRQELIACGRDIERQIFAKCKIKPEDINDESIKPIIEKLKDFVIS